MNPGEARELNQRWVDGYDTPEGREKVAALNQRWISDHVGEGAVLNRLRKPVSVTPQECERTVEHRNPVIIEEIREGSYAMPIDFSGSTKGEIVRDNRYAIAFQKIQSATHYYYVEQLWTSKRPVIEHLKEDMAEALGDALDRTFVTHVETAVWFLFDEVGSYADAKFNLSNLRDGTVTEVTVFKSSQAKLVEDDQGAALDNFEIQPLKKQDFTILLQAFNNQDGQQLRADSAIMTDFDYAPVTDWTLEEVGDSLVSKSVEGVVGYKSLKNIKLVRTGKHRFFRPGNIDAFTSWDLLGSYYKIGGIDTWQDKRANRVEMNAWMYIGFGFGNIAGLRKMELYSGSAHPKSDGTMYDTGYAIVQPKAEEHRIKNHRADERNWKPSFLQW